MPVLETGLIFLHSPLPASQDQVGTGESVYNLTLAGLALVLSLVLVWESTPRSCGCSRAATGWCAPPLALLQYSPGLGSRCATRPQSARAALATLSTHGFWHQTDT